MLHSAAWGAVWGRRAFLPSQRCASTHGLAQRCSAPEHKSGVGRAGAGQGRTRRLPGGSGPSRPPDGPLRTRYHKKAAQYPPPPTPQPSPHPLRRLLPRQTPGLGFRCHQPEHSGGDATSVSTSDDQKQVPPLQRDENRLLASSRLTSFESSPPS
jgi:hypothetical protein